MIKYYKNIKDYANSKWIHRDTASKRLKNWLTGLQLVPKGVKYYEIDKEAVIAEYIKSLSN